MNERIREIAQQAGWISDAEFSSWNKLHQYQNFNMEKFVELILADVDYIVNELYQALPLEKAVVLLTLDENIKQHFYGVE